MEHGVQGTVCYRQHGEDGASVSARRIVLPLGPPLRSLVQLVVAAYTVKAHIVMAYIVMASSVVAACPHAQRPMVSDVTPILVCCAQQPRVHA